MNVTSKPLAETTHRAITVLSKELGIAETVRFLTQFGSGFGDYTRERDAMFQGLTMDELLSAIRRSPRQAPKPRNKRVRG